VGAAWIEKGVLVRAIARVVIEETLQLACVHIYTLLKCTDCADGEWEFGAWILAVVHLGSIQPSLIRHKYVEC
jgi:uncharacterized MnhB-related membrane protein